MCDCAGYSQIQSLKPVSKIIWLQIIIHPNLHKANISIFMTLS